MIDFEFESALQALSGIAESLDAAGVDRCLPLHDEFADQRGRQWRGRRAMLTVPAAAVQSRQATPDCLRALGYRGSALVPVNANDVRDAVPSNRESAMKSVITFTAVPLMMLATVTTPASAQDTHERHATPSTHTAQARRWDTDAPLRTGMASIRVAVDALEHQGRGHRGGGPVVALAKQIEQQIAYLVANCKLEPQADAALHGIIAALGSNAQALKSNPADRSAIPKMRHALQSYSRQFNDPVQTSADEPEEKH